MAKIRVTKVRSVIKRPENQKRNMLALGLRKMNQTVEHDDTPTVMGIINKVRHLVSVETV